MNLGIVLTPYGQLPNGAPPWEVGYSYGGDGTFLCPPDEFHNTRGEVGLYPDTQLGRSKGPIKKFFARMGLGRGIPTDQELQARYGYVPMINGEVAFKQGFQPGTWIPPNGWNPAGGYGPQFQPVTGSLNGYDGLEDGASVTDGSTDPTSGASANAPMPTQGYFDFRVTESKKINWLLVLTTASTAGILITSVFSIVSQLRKFKR